MCILKFLIIIIISEKENLKEDEEIIAENYDEAENRGLKKDSHKNSINTNDSTYDNDELKAHIEAKFRVRIYSVLLKIRYIFFRFIITMIHL